MITRQRATLRLIEREGGEVTKLRLVKLSFLLAQTAKNAPAAARYEFLPYQFGPYSFTLGHELRALERDGWLKVHEKDVVIARSLGAESARLDRRFGAEIDDLATSLQAVSTDAIIDRVYRDYPWYTANAKDKRKRRMSLPIAEPAVYSVGYEGLMLDGLLDLLLRSGIRRLIDVRRNPVARRFGFHRSTLERHCNDVGIEYCHIPELGIPSSLRADLNCLADYERLFETYENSILPSNAASVAVVARMIGEKPSAVMCMEQDARFCHRTRLARALAKSTGLPHRELREA
jgi:uncharacterized protein (DUF488 family)